MIEYSLLKDAAKGREDMTLSPETFITLMEKHSANISLNISGEEVYIHLTDGFDGILLESDIGVNGITLKVEDGNI